jgi:XTP/dITP diphosphohydrolase
MEIGLITGNEGKVREISKRLDTTDIDIRRIDGEFIEVQCDTLDEVVTRGLELFTRENGDDLALMKDDSGLFIDALDGFPGVYSAYVNKTIDNDGILDLMKGKDNRYATFKTVIGLFLPGKGITLFEGGCRGKISHEISGMNGFGFDPIFIPDGFDVTFAMMETELKNSMSHRIRALEKMISFIRGL